mmetsp:Transcript_17184/g.24048  ORF Transcript_17184/g.24048 Transcript_17184/m.24048 type:complete len:199 (-) Transcript_17184:539-1135(-)
MLPMMSHIALHMSPQDARSTFWQMSPMDPNTSPTEPTDPQRSPMEPKSIAPQRSPTEVTEPHDPKSSPMEPGLHALMISPQLAVPSPITSQQGPHTPPIIGPQQSPIGPQILSHAFPHISPQEPNGVSAIHPHTSPQLPQTGSIDPHKGSKDANNPLQQPPQQSPAEPIKLPIPDTAAPPTLDNPCAVAFMAPAPPNR